MKKLSSIQGTKYSRIWCLIQLGIMCTSRRDAKFSKSKWRIVQSIQTVRFVWKLVTLIADGAPWRSGELPRMISFNYFGDMSRVLRFVIAFQS